VVLKHPALVLPIGYLQLLAAQLPISMVPIVSVESLSWREIGKRFYLRGLDLGTLLGGEMFDPIALVRDVLPHFVDESEDESEDCDGVEIANISALELNAINAGYSEVQTYVMNPISSECVDNYAPTT
jgi:hypothetical protein